MKYRTLHNHTLDIIVWKHYGYTSGSFEAVLEANPGLSAYGPVLPSGIVIELPSITPPKPAEKVRLWD